MGLAVWRDISLLWLIFLTFFAILPFGVIFFFFIKGLHRLRQLAKEYLPIAQEKARLVSETTERISHKVANPFIEAQATSAEVGGIARSIFARRKRT
jgi:hypothetical protein